MNGGGAGEVYWREENGDNSSCDGGKDLWRKSKKYYELQALDLWDFPALIRKAREIQDITMEALCKDICSFSMMGKIERGERLAGKELRDRILARLGVCSDGYENFLFYEDYLVWKRNRELSMPLKSPIMRRRKIY